MRSSSDVHEFLLREGVRHEIVDLPTLCATSVQAAEALGVPVAEVVKSLVFLVDGRPVLALVSGDATVDADALARAMGGTGATLARGRDVRAMTGYRPGAVPPCGLATPLPVAADPGVFVTETVYCGGGTATAMLRIRSLDLEALLRPLRASIAVRAADTGRTLARTDGRTR